MGTEKNATRRRTRSFSVNVEVYPKYTLQLEVDVGCDALEWSRSRENSAAIFILERDNNATVYKLWIEGEEIWAVL